MKTFTGIVLFSTLLAAAYGVLFSMYYPSVAIDANILATFAFAGIVTTVILVWLWRAVRGKAH